LEERAALRSRVERAVGALFTIEEEIGRGGMAVVYRARDVRLHRKVALKVLPPELAFRADVKSRFLREAQMAAQLSHPNIVPIYAVDDSDGVVYFAMGLVEGETLAQSLAHDPRPHVDVVRRILREVAEALAYAHAHGVVHRDVKPDNILVDRESGRALVSDFGIARAAEGDGRMTATGVAVGTPAYMSPEQAMGERDVDGRADQYSLGIVGYQMLAGELPHQASNTPAMLMKHISERPRPLHEVRPELPANLVYAIERAMGKGRDERWPDAAAFRDALAADAVVSGTLPVPPEQGGGIYIGARMRVPGIGDAAAFGADVGVRVAGHVLGSMGMAPRGDSPATGSPAQPPFPRFPALPPNWMFNPDTREYGREALREWKEKQKEWRQRYRGEPRDLVRQSRRELRAARRGEFDGELTPEERIRRIQRQAAGYLFTVGFLAAINLMTSPHFPWFLFPALGMGIGLATRISALWVDGIPLRRLFRRQPMKSVAAVAGERDHVPRAVALPAPAPDLSGSPREVLDGPHGAVLREAAEARSIIIDVLAKLSDADRQMLPEIKPTVDALDERIRSLAQALHQLDADASPAAIARLAERIATAEASPADAPDRERRLELLERQRATLNDLAARRGAVAQQLESAVLVLQTMRLDLLKLRSSGLETKLDATTSATQEARALSSDIGRVLDAANEVRKL
jgi:serine/threonine-protein kinase